MPQIKGADHLTIQEQQITTQRSVRGAERQPDHAGVAPWDSTTSSRGGATVVSRCVVNGVVTYSDHECFGRASRQVAADASVNLADGMPNASAHLARVQPPSGQTVHRTSGAGVVASPSGSPVDPSAIRDKCAALEQEVRALDAAARHALLPFEQDRLAARRKLARDSQFRLNWTEFYST